MMKPLIECLHDEEVGRLLTGDVDAARTSELEQHLANCIDCRQRLEQQVGDDGWWNETESSLRSQQVDSNVAASLRDAGDGRAYAPSFGETRLSESVLDLLGPTDDPNMLGRIGPYEIIGLLGQGGMGAVFKGFDRSLNRFVAIKMLLPHLAASGAARKRFAREGQAVAAVVDDHVMAIHCVDEWQGVPYLVMTYSRGVSLHKRLSENGPLEVREILRIGMQAAKGLAAAHAQGIVHRDIKPANIFLDQNVERVQLMDFGLARAVDDASLTRSGTLAGTPQYMSPEQARAETVDHRSDLFSLGSVMYAMCTGHAPFRAESSYSVLHLITDKEPRPIRELNPDIPQWLCVIIKKLMAKQANNRFQSAKNVADFMEACLAHVHSPSTAALPASIRNSKPSRFPSLQSIIIGVFVMSCLTLLSLLLFLQTAEPLNTNGDSTAKKISEAKQSDPLANFRIAGKCVDENGNPIHEASIELYLNAEANGSFKTTQTKADGTFDLGAFRDPELTAEREVNYIVVGRAKGKAIAYGFPLGHSVVPSAMELVLGVPGQLTGTITGPDGSPVKNARVKKAGPPWIEGVNGAITNEAGKYVLERVPLLEHPGFVRKTPKGIEMIPVASQYLIVEHPDFGLTQPAYAECPSTVDASFDLPATFTGRVIDEMGLPIAGVKVAARPNRKSGPVTKRFSYNYTETNIKGEYSILLQYDGTIEILFIGSTHLAKTINDVLAKAGETTSVPDVTAISPAFVVGRIVDADTDNTVACPAGVRLRVYAMGDGALRSVVIQPDGTYRLPVLPGSTFVYFSLSSDSLRELTSTWDVLDHPNPLTADKFPVKANTEAPVEVNFPVKMNKEKLSKVLQTLQGEWEIQSGTYVEGGNARLSLTPDRLLDGDRNPLRFTIRGNQWIGHSQYFCSALEPELGQTLCAGTAHLELDVEPSPQSLMLTRFENGHKQIHRCFYRIHGDSLELVCNSSSTNDSLPKSHESPQQSFVLNAKRLVDTGASSNETIER